MRDKAQAFLIICSAEVILNIWGQLGVYSLVPWFLQ